MTNYEILGSSSCPACGPLVSAAHRDDVLAIVQGATADREDFMANVIWFANPEKAYYACTERMELLTLELWVGS